MAGIVVSNKVRRLVGNRLKEIDVPTTTLNTALYYADLTAQDASFTQSGVNAELNAYPVTVKNNASLALTPSANKTGVVYALNGDSKTLEEFEFQRGSSGTYFDASGVMQLAAPNVPRNNFENGVSKGLLIEPSSSNLCIDSGLINGLESTLAKSTVGLTAVDTNFNKGTLLSKGIRMELNLTDIVYAYKPFSANLDAIYTFSVFVKMDDGSLPTSNDIKIVAQGAIISHLPVINCGNNVYRIVFSFVGRKNGIEHVGLAKYTNLSNKSLIITGFQIEQYGQVSSYIPTTTAIGTRLADKVLSKRPIVVFPKNSIFVKTAEYPSVWFENGVLYYNRNYHLNGRKFAERLRPNSGTTAPISIGQDSLGAWVTGTLLSSNIFQLSTYFSTNLNDGIGTLYSKDLYPLMGKTLIYSVEVMSPQPVSLYFTPTFGNFVNKITLVPNVWKRIYSSKVVTSSNELIASFFTIEGDNIGIPVGTKLYLRDYTIEVQDSTISAWQPAPEDYVKVDGSGNVEISYDEPIHIQQLSLISRELTQGEV